MAALGALALALPSCKEEKPVQAVPVASYIQPDTPPTYASPRGDEKSDLRFTDVTKPAGIEFTHITGAFGKQWMPETMGGGGAFFDYDGDGGPDILLVNGTYWPGHASKGPAPSSKLYHNRGDGIFEDASESSGISKLNGYGMGAAIADYDGDGDEDIYITAVGKNHLLRNDGGRFTDVTDEASVGFSTCNGQASEWEWSTGATWVDYDRDGDLDLFVANYVQWTPETDLWTTLDGKNKSYATPQQYKGATCVLFRNDGDGTFVDATKNAGVFNPEGKSLSVVADDFNDDGWPDLFVTNDTQPNFLYINNADAKSPGFTDRALSAGVAYDEVGLARAGMGVSVADVGNAGPRSIAIGNFAGEPLSLYTQVGVDTFVDQAGATRLSKPTDNVLTFGVLFADFNLDGYDDLMLANGHIEPSIASVRKGWSFAQPIQLFLNNRAGRFVDISSEAGDTFASPMVGRCVASADIDGDGDLDVLVTANGGSPRLLRNDQPGDAHSIRVKLVGKGKNLAAIGSRLRAKIGPMTVTRYVTTGGSYLSQSELTATFGLGAATAIDDLEIRWPDGLIEKVESLPADAIGGVTYTIKQGQGVVRTDRRKSYFDGRGVQD